MSSSEYLVLFIDISVSSILNYPRPRPKNIFAKTGKIQRDGSWLGLIWKWKTVLKQLSLFFHFRRSPLLFKASWQFRMEMVIAIVKFVKRIQVTSHFLFNLKNWKGLYSKRTKSFLLTKRRTRFINRRETAKQKAFKYLSRIVIDRINSSNATSKITVLSPKI